jgi:hypothetical protein
MFQAVAKCNNRTSFVIGEATKDEIEIAQGEDPSLSCQGLYLIAIDTENPRAAGSILARFTSEEAAGRLANFFRVNGFLEA